MTRLDRIRKESERIMGTEPAHDFDHVLRVCKNAEFLCKKEGIDPELTLAAALLHDIVSHPKTGGDAKNSSKESAELAVKILQDNGYSVREAGIVADAISSHSYSAGEVPTTEHGKILQDADRLDALGAVGIARAFAVAGSEKRKFYDTKDPFCSGREPDDKVWTVDHFYKKLLKLEGLMNTEPAREEAKRRTKILTEFLDHLKKEIQP